MFVTPAQIMRTTSSMLRVLLSLQLLLLVSGYSYYQQEIPNGDHVPHPCLPNYIWRGVGHEKMGGGGKRNPFGKDFAAEENKFTKTLCEMDSDGDGRSNGEELGDPDCVWRKGELPTRTSNITHPGVCEPITSDKCKKLNTWSFCDQRGFECNDTKAKDVQNITLRFDKTTVPATVTNYYCMLFDLPSDRDYHIIATKPELDNIAVMHHMILSGCDTVDQKLLDTFSTPAPCGMQAQGACGTQIGGWTVGSVGSCSEGLNAGFRIGNTSYTKVLLEFHWNNPRLKAGMTDESALTLFFTPKLRDQDLGVLVVGQLGLEIPPRMDRVEMKGVCRAKCTKQLKHPLYIVDAGMHMHYLGIAGLLEQYRDGKLIKDLAKDDPYYYDSPADHFHDPPAVLQPGDSLVTHCIFKSTYREGITYWGDGTQEEMCLSFITYYPKVDFNSCIQFGNKDMCTRGDAEKWGDCPLQDKTTMEKLYTDLSLYCDMSGQKCTEACKEFLLVNPHACLQGDNKFFLEWIMPKWREDGYLLTLGSRSCDMERLRMQQQEGTSPVGGSGAGGWGVRSSLQAAALMALVAMLIVL